MPRRWTALASAAVLLGQLAAGHCALADDPLRMLTWSDYIDPEVVTAFERAHGEQLELVFYESDDLRTRALAESDGRGYDIVLVAGTSLRSYARRGWIAPIPVSEVPNRRHVNPRWRDAFPDAQTHGVPYAWGTLGIGYRRDLVPFELRRWDQLLRPDEALRGRIVMVRSVRDLIGMSLKSLGQSANSGDLEQIARAESVLIAQKPFVRSYSYIALTSDSALVTGEASAAMMYNGDALMLRDLHPEIAFIVPDEGSNLWVDYLTIAGRSTRSSRAARFIDFVNRPEIAAQNARHLHYATPNAAAETLLPESFRSDPLIYPPRSVLDRSEVYAELSPTALKRASAAVARVTR